MDPVQQQLNETLYHAMAILVVAANAENPPETVRAAAEMFNPRLDEVRLFVPTGQGPERTTIITLAQDLWNFENDRSSALAANLALVAMTMDYVEDEHLDQHPELNMPLTLSTYAAVTATRPWGETWHMLHKWGIQW